MEDDRSLYERVWGEEPTPYPASDILSPAPGRSKLLRRRRSDPAGEPLEPAEESVEFEPSLLEGTLPEPEVAGQPSPGKELQSWAAAIAKSSAEHVEASLSKKLNYLESRMLNLTRFTREEIEKSAKRTAPAPVDLKGIEETLTTIVRRVAAMEGIESRLKLLEGTISRSERRAQVDEKSLEQRIADLMDNRPPQEQNEELARRLDNLHDALAHFSRVQPDERDNVMAGMIKLIDDRLGAGPIADLGNRMNDLAAALGQTWRQAMSQNTEDQLRVVGILETRLESVVGEMKEQAAGYDRMQSRIDSDLLNGFTKLAGQITTQLNAIESHLERSVEEQRRASNSVVSSVEAMAQSLDKFLTWEMDTRRRERNEPT